MKRDSLTKTLTVVYLILAGVVSVATSKSPDGSNQVTAAYTMNYSVRSNCSGGAYDIDAMRVDQGVISQIIRADGRLHSAGSTDFQTLGFPNTYAMIGVNSYNADSTQKCEVRTKYSTINRDYDSSQTQYQYIQPGYLTQVQYDCYTSSRYVCSSTFTELRQGDLLSVY